jgi:hypothetical protein
MTPDQELAELCDDYPGWHIWRGRDGHGRLDGWHATSSIGFRSAILAADGPAELRQRLQQALTRATAIPS